MKRSISFLTQRNFYAEFHLTIKKTKIILMKHVGLVFTSVALFLLSFVQTSSIEKVLVALRTGNATELAKYFDSRIDISLPNKSDNYSKNQAEMILKDFFVNNEVKNFQVKHKGENNGSQFCIGLLQTKNGNFRTKIYMKKKGSQQVVQEIAFQAEE